MPDFNCPCCDTQFRYDAAHWPACEQCGTVWKPVDGGFVEDSNLADWDICDEHETVFWGGTACPKCAAN